MPKIPLDPFRACIFSASETAEWAYRSQVALAGMYLSPTISQTSRTLISSDLIAFVCIVVFILKLEARNGQSRMTQLMRTFVQDGTLYFFTMMGFHIAMVFFVFFARVIAFLPSVGKCVLTS